MTEVEVIKTRTARARCLVCDWVALSADPGPRQVKQAEAHTAATGHPTRCELVQWLHHRLQK